MPLLLKPVADKLKGKLPAAKASIENVIKIAGIPPKPDMPVNVAAQVEEMSSQLKARAQDIMAAYKEYEAALVKLLAKV